MDVNGMMVLIGGIYHMVYVYIMHICIVPLSSEQSILYVVDRRIIITSYLLVSLVLTTQSCIDLLIIYMQFTHTAHHSGKVA